MILCHCRGHFILFKGASYWPPVQLLDGQDMSHDRNRSLLLAALAALLAAQQKLMLPGVCKGVYNTKNKKGLKKSETGDIKLPMSLCCKYSGKVGNKPFENH